MDILEQIHPSIIAQPTIRNEKKKEVNERKDERSMEGLKDKLTTSKEEKSENSDIETTRKDTTTQKKQVYFEEDPNVDIKKQKLLRSKHISLADGQDRYNIIDEVNRLNCNITVTN